MHFYQQTKITATAAFETGRATEVGAAEGSRCVAVLCHPWTQLAFPGNGPSGQKVKNPINLPFPTGSLTRVLLKTTSMSLLSVLLTQSEPWSAAAEANTALQRALTIQTDLHILISPQITWFSVKELFRLSWLVFLLVPEPT